jgi:type I restriction enzyme S subunit
VEVRPGYKRTEVGVIPEDWEASKLGKHATFRTGPFGSALHQSDYVDSGVPVINPMQIVDGKIQATPSMTITERAAQKLSDFRLSTGDIIIGRRGEMGRCALVRPEQHGWLCGTGSMIIRTGTSLDGHFIQYVLSSPPAVAAIENASVGTTMINLNQDTLGNLFIPLPPTLAEQRAIAAALSDVDALITALDHLIAKKRAIKQGAMQQLLTGQTRLPGFSGEWEVRKLGEVGEINRDNLGSNTSPDYSFKYISLEDVDFGVLRDYSEQVFSTAPSRARRIVKKNDVLISTVRPNLKSHLLIKDDVLDFICSTGFSVLTCNPAIAEPAYVYAHLFAYGIEQQIEALLSGSNYPAINSSDVEALQIPLPPLPEQRAIAAVLSDMDAEIAALEARREKTRALKQGMMQELLTGRIRLV